MERLGAIIAVDNYFGKCMPAFAKLDYTAIALIKPC